MEVRALSKYVRMSCKKMHGVARVLVGKRADEALQLLKFVPRKSARFIAKTLESAIANANCKGIQSDGLFVKQAVIEQGVVFKRFIPASRGSAHPIRKRTSHIKVVLSDSLTLK